MKTHGMQPSNGIIPYGKHIGALLTLGIPIIIGQLGSIVQGLADTVMVGRFSAQALAAAGFVNNVMFLVLVSALGYSYALTPVVGPLHARKEYHKAGHALRAGLQVNGLLGAVLFFVMGSLYFCLGHMGQPEELLPEIRPYYLIVLLSLPLQTVFNGFKQFFDGVGRTREPMWIMPFPSARASTIRCSSRRTTYATTALAILSTTGSAPLPRV